MADPEFEVVLGKTGGTFLIPPNKSILEVLQENGIYSRYDCESGICGTCLVPLSEGEADHRDEYLTDAEKESGQRIAICVSRAKTRRLILDL